MKRIIYQNDKGTVSVITPAPEYLETHTVEDVALKDVPKGKEYHIIDTTDLPPDRTFRNAWVIDEGKPIEDLEKSKVIAHEKRREAREKEFAPYDEIIIKQIPGNDLVKAERARQAIRDKYATIQTQMDGAETVGELKALLPSI